jgi:uncharacterized protein (UPF0335 family)
MVEVSRNTASSEKLMAFIERIERLREMKKNLAADEKVVFAEVKAEGFSTKRIGDILKIRAMNPHEREEAEAELDMYLHAIGMATEAPLFRQVGLMSVDVTAREQVIDAMKLLVPPNGEFIIKVGGQPVRIWRDETSNVYAEDYKPPEAAKPKENRGGYQAPPKAEVPDVDLAGAGTLGREGYKQGVAIIKNPFPWDDPRRAAWDRGWRDEGGGDGMGPKGDD